MAQPALKLESEEPATEPRDDLLDALKELGESFTLLERAIQRRQRLYEDREGRLTVLSAQHEQLKSDEKDARLRLAKQLIQTAERIEDLLCQSTYADDMNDNWADDEQMEDAEEFGEQWDETEEGAAGLLAGSDESESEDEADEALLVAGSVCAETAADNESTDDVNAYDDNFWEEGEWDELAEEERV